MISKEKVQSDIEDVKTRLNKIPTVAEYLANGKYGKGMVSRRFGSWGKAMEEIFQVVKPKAQILSCGFCNKEIKVIPSDLKKVNYCSRSCANKADPRRSVEGYCRICEEPLQASRTYCDSCLQKRSFENKTLGQLRQERRDATRYSQVREHARRLSKKNRVELQCKNCSYDKHVHTCHIKDLCDFPDEATVGEVNQLSNLVYLCPNCHWEFDNGLLEL